ATSTRSRSRSLTGGCKRPWTPRKSRLRARPRAIRAGSSKTSKVVGQQTPVHWLYRMAALTSIPTDTVEKLYSELESRLHELRPSEDLAPLMKAFRFAAERHKGQNRVSGEPYMVHPLMVTRLLADMNMDMVCLQTGLLHDVVEDTSAKVEDIR